MQRVLVLCCALLLGSPALAAQSTAQAPSQDINQYHPQKFDPQAAQARLKEQIELWQAAQSSCPVSVQAKQSAGWDMVKVGPSSVLDSSPFQSIRLILAGGKKGQIVAARIKVRGLTDKPHILATPAQDGPAEITRYLNLTFNGDEMNEVAADLTLHGFTSVKSIDLVSLTYADGETWKSGQIACRAVPDPMMLIGAR